MTDLHVFTFRREDEELSISNSDHTVDDLQSAYERRRQVQQRQVVAVNVWRKK